jgi:hypothetical protein
MRKLDKIFLSVLGLAFFTGSAAHAQLGVGTGSTPPRTMLDVNGPIAVAETAATLTGANPAYTIAATVAQLRLSNGGTAPTGTAALTAAASPAPVTGQRLLVFNNTTIPATLNGSTVPSGQTTEFIYSAGSWRASTGGGDLYTTDGTLASARTVTLGGNDLTFTGSGDLNKLSGAAGTASTINVGRTDAEASFGTIATANSLVAGTVAGDASLFTGNTTANMVLGTPTSSTGTVRLATRGSERLRITSGGLVGVNNANPTYTLDVTGSARVSSNFYMNGYMGINTTSPSFPIDVQNSGGGVSGSYGYLSSSGGTGTTNTSQTVSIRAIGRVAASEFNAMSDQRLKTIKGLSDSRHDLQLLRQVQVTDYQMRDQMQYGDRDFKKVIAQQVETVYPQAINKMKGFVPTIYHNATLAPSAADQTVVTLPAAHGLQVGDLVRVFGEANEKVETKVLAVGSATSFSIALPKPETKLFVYGPEVDDLRTVDYEALAMLNLSATQELARQVDALTAANATLKAANATLRTRRNGRASASTVREMQASLQALQAEVQALRAGSTTASIR